MRAVSLMYHDVVEPGREEGSGFPGGPARIYKLSTTRFADHLDAVAASGAVVCNNVETLAEAPQPPVLFTFDDGGVSFLDPIAGMLEARGWRGHFFITTGRIDTPGFLTSPQVRELAVRGHVVGSHSMSHPTRMADLAPAQLAEEWTGSRARLEDILGRPILTASVPGGYFSRQVAAEAAMAGYRHLFHSEPVTTIADAGSLRLYGRFPLQSASPASLAGGLARGDTWPHAKMWTLRNLKKAAKAAGGSWLIRLHSRLLDPTDD
jgi:peptidoglycan/xylan/chitin deacetylase (PgdA/CDA1 family)